VKLQFGGARSGIQAVNRYFDLNMMRGGPGGGPTTPAAPTASIAVIMYCFVYFFSVSPLPNRNQQLRPGTAFPGALIK
jgi:hypothetical protein